MMNKLKRTSAVLFVAALLAVAGCASTSEKKGGGSYFDDAAITAKVKTAIYNEPTLKVGDISVTTEDKVVQLSGSVKSRAERTKAAQVARKVEGVKTVKNDLQVTPQAGAENRGQSPKSKKQEKPGSDPKAAQAR